MANRLMLLVVCASIMTPNIGYLRLPKKSQVPGNSFGLKSVWIEVAPWIWKRQSKPGGSEDFWSSPTGRVPLRAGFESCSASQKLI